MSVKHALGYQNYEAMMKNQIFYIDKTYFIREWWDYADMVTLITRPRRFGKTLNMSTVECFLSNKYNDRSDLFEGKKLLFFWMSMIRRCRKHGFMDTGRKLLLVLKLFL